MAKRHSPTIDINLFMLQTRLLQHGQRLRL